MSSGLELTITAYTTTSTIQAPAGFTPAKGPDWRPKIKARDSLNTLKERAAVELFPAGLQSNPEYVQRVDCTKKVPSTSIKVTTITVKGTRVTASPKTKTKVITSSTTTELHVKLGPTVVTVCSVALRYLKHKAMSKRLSLVFDSSLSAWALNLQVQTLKTKAKIMAHSASGSEPISTQQHALKTPPSNKPSAYVFDSNGDTRIILSTYMAQSFKWEADKIWIEQEKPTKAYYRKKSEEVNNECSKAPLSDLIHAPYTPPESSDGDETDGDEADGNEADDNEADGNEADGNKADLGFDDPPASPDLTSLQVQDWDYGETCQLPLEKIDIRMLVSGKHLELASPIFKTMLTGPFIEGNADSSGVRRITASDWDPQAFYIVLSIMHGYHRDVPRSISFDLLVKVAMIANYYDCLESVEVYTDMWLKTFESELPEVYGRDCILYLFLSWVFSRPIMFQRMTQLALRHSQKVIEAEDFPLPADIIEAIDISRQSALAEIFSAVYALFDLLQGDEECYFECSSMLLGVLTKELGIRGILYPRNAPPFNGFSIEGSQEMIWELRKPTWHRGPNWLSHSCCIQDRLSMSLAKVESNLHVFNLQDFQSVKNHDG
ncbi:hypothetical protein FPSE_07754 [Fusarium pseudograminearum CS3096]|uniref:BTB domain-containing protein n=1 Tax=Fusarium pseudograminearum (strain CS3096) TaxID=1028729 RepID=K3VE18_FUSPC|nr:hypothetical protein FPSE_07754 [Fusarium pseudograminearum CS3096]EKJ72064.1 hypothetical protein FPSE_07754 [Fusarium pseudograminearum CS3096]